VKILVMTNMGRSREHPFSDVYVAKQLDLLRRLVAPAVAIEYFSLRRKVTSALGSLIKYLHAFLRFLPHCLRRYDIIHLHYGYPLLLFLFAYKLLHPQSKAVVTLHGSDVNRDMRHGFKSRLFSQLIKRVNHVIAVSHALSAEAGRGLRRRADTVLSAGIDSRVFYRVTGVEKRYDLIFVGQFLEAKGVRLLLHAIEEIGDATLAVCFAGSGPLLSEIALLRERFALTIKLNALHDHLRLLYNQSRFLILPSESEGLPLVIGEALFCGTPVIATDVGGVAELVVDGYNGFLLPDRSARAIAAQVRNLRQIGPAAYHRLVENALLGHTQFSLEHVCRTQLAIYETLLGSSLTASPDALAPAARA
jgi:glycosyltransferase involved in cell wall biosynthesis